MEQRSISSFRNVEKCFVQVRTACRILQIWIIQDLPFVAKELIEMFVFDSIPTRSAVGLGQTDFWPCCLFGVCPIRENVHFEPTLRYQRHVMYYSYFAPLKRRTLKMFVHQSSPRGHQIQRGSSRRRGQELSMYTRTVVLKKKTKGQGVGLILVCVASAI